MTNRITEKAMEIKMERKEKIDYAMRYSHELAAEHSVIAGIILGGSLARGDDLPISDIDLWCFVDESAYPLPIEKHSAGGVFIDIEQHSSEMLISTEIGEDPYVCGYFRDAVILFDRDGQTEECQKRVRAYLVSPSLRRAHLSSIRASVERNFKAFSASIEAQDASEVCRSSIFAIWSLCDYLLTARGVSPGGARGLARLAGVWPDAANPLVEFEGFADMDHAQIDCLHNIYLNVADRSPFFEMWFQKVEWMFANGHRPDAFHALWIALGLRIKETKVHSSDLSYSQLETACERWLTTIGWDHLTGQRKLNQLRELIDLFCCQETKE